jgi:peptide/nickel transport system substrate-binding protein
MRNESLLRAVVGGAFGLVLVLLGVVIVQMNHLEARLIAQGQQIRTLGEATDKLATSGLRVAARGTTATPDEGPPPGVKFLHPEAPNFLKPADTHWPPPGASTDGSLVRGWDTGDPKGFNPILENSGYTTELISVYCDLSLASPNNWTNPSLWHGEAAYRVEITDDSKEFTFYLRDGLTWPKPIGVNLDDPTYAWLKGEHPVTAEDFAFTAEMILNPQVESGPHRNYYADLESFKALDAHTLVLRWKKKLYTNLAQSLSLSAMPKFLYTRDEHGVPFPKETLGTRFNQHWYNHKGFFGAGPYAMTSYQPGTKIGLTRNETFPLEKPAIQSITYPVYTDRAQTMLKLKAHELSVGELSPGQYREEIQQYEASGKKPPADSPFFDGRIHCQPVLSGAYRYIGWNADRPFFEDKRVRRAMTLAFNREQILKDVFVGLGVLITGPFSPDAPYVDPTVQPIPYDLEAAKKLLTEAGWTDSDGDGLRDKAFHAGEPRKPFSFTFVVPTGIKESLVLANILRDDLLKIGVKMNIETAEWSLFLKRMDEKNFDAYAAAWTTGWDEDLFQIWHSSQADIPKGSNRIGFRNKEADRIIEALRAAFAPEERKQLFQAFHRLVADEQPYSFFSAKKTTICTWKEVENVVFSKQFPTVVALPWSVRRTEP